MKRILSIIIGVSVLTGAAPSAAAELPDPVADPAAFADPPAGVGPKTRWWWTSPEDGEEMRQELGAIADAGFGGAEIAFFGAWSDERQRKALSAALQTAHDRKLSLDMTMGRAWPVRTPDAGGDPANLNHAQEMMYGTASVIGPGDYRVPPPPPSDLNVHTGAGFEAGVEPAEAKLLRVTAALVAEEGTPVVFTAPNVPFQALAPTAPARSTVLDPESVIDLTPTIAGDGTVHFAPDKPGRWVIFALWQRPTAQGVMDHLRAEAADAVTSYLDQHQIGPANAKALVAGSYFFEDSLELVFNGVPWTEGFLEEFKRQRGYDLAPFAPALFVQDAYNVPGHDPRNMPNADYEFADHVGSRVRHDFLRTLTELYRRNHLEKFQAWARSHGMRFRAQPYSSPFDASAASRTLASAGAGVDIESLGAGDPAAPGSPQARFAQDLYRIMVGGSAQGGGDDVGNELGATFLRDYMVSLSEYKALMDKAWAAGVTTPILHGFAYSPPDAPWPGRNQFTGIVAQSWNHRYFPEWPMWRRLTDYWSRGSWVLRAGRPLEDIAIYRDASFASGGVLNVVKVADSHLPVPLTDDQGNHPVTDNTPANPPPLFDGRALERAGYTYQYVDRDGLQDERAAGKGVLFPKGPSYRVLVVRADAMAGDAAQALAGHVARGLAVVIVGDPPRRGASNSSRAREDEQVVKAFQKILSSPRTRIVDTESDVLGALRSLDVEPGVRLSRPAPLMSQRRQTAKTDYWYLWNGGTQTMAVSASFATTGVPKTLDLWSGAIEPVAQYTRSGDRVHVPIVLRPGETRVLAFDRTGSPRSLHVIDSDAEAVTLRGRKVELRDSTGGGTRFVALSSGEERVLRLAELPAPLSPASWKLHVKRSQPSPEGAEQDFELSALEDWRRIPGLEDASGTGTYATRIDLPADWTVSDRGVQLDLGTVWGSVQVFVNGQLVTPRATTHQQYDAPWLKSPETINGLDVTRHVRAGANEVKVVLATTLKNAVTAEAKRGNGNLTAQAALGGTQPYGLKGPVLLRPLARASFMARPASSCTSRRRILVHLPSPRGFRAVRTTIQINGKRKRGRARRAGRRLAVPVDLRPLPRGRVKVRVTIRGERGRLRTVRTYRLCAKRSG